VKVHYRYKWTEGRWRVVGLFDAEQARHRRWQRGYDVIRGIQFSRRDALHLPANWMQQQNDAANRAIAESVWWAWKVGRFV